MNINEAIDRLADDPEEDIHSEECKRLSRESVEYIYQELMKISPDVMVAEALHRRLLRGDE